MPNISAANTVTVYVLCISPDFPIPKSRQRKAPLSRFPAAAMNQKPGQAREDGGRRNELLIAAGLLVDGWQRAPDLPTRAPSGRVVTHAKTPRIRCTRARRALSRSLSCPALGIVFWGSSNSRSKAASISGSSVVRLCSPVIFAASATTRFDRSASAFRSRASIDSEGACSSELLHLIEPFF